MKLADFKRLKAMMARTTSENDAEALASIRAANRLLAAESLTWERVLDRTVSVRCEVEDAPRGVDGPEHSNVDDMFDDALARAAGGFRDFLLSLQAQWEERGRLSEAQMDALVRSARR